MTKATPHNINFREPTLFPIFNRIIDGDSINIVGVGTVGKTHLIKHFTERIDVQDYFLKDKCNSNLSSNDLVFLRIDPNALLELPVSFQSNLGVPHSWLGMELIFRKLLASVRDRDPDPSNKKSLFSVTSKLYSKSHDRENLGPVLIFALLEEAITNFLEEYIPNGRLVIVFDEFQRMLNLPDTFFLNLRSLRDLFRYQICYVAATRQDLNQLVPRERAAILEPFMELFRDTIYIGAYASDSDLEELVTYLTHRKLGSDVRLDDHVFQRVKRLTGGHGGLVRTCFDYISQIEEARDDQVAIQALLQFRPVARECLVLLESLSVEEKSLLGSIAKERDFDPILSNRGVLRDLQNKQIVTELKTKVYIVPPLLNYFIYWREQGYFKGEDYAPYPPS